MVNKTIIKSDNNGLNRWLSIPMCIYMYTVHWNVLFRTEHTSSYSWSVIVSSGLNRRRDVVHHTCVPPIQQWWGLAYRHLTGLLLYSKTDIFSTHLCIDTNLIDTNAHSRWISVNIQVISVNIQVISVNIQVISLCQGLV